jgi:hypothetical protein
VEQQQQQWRLWSGSCRLAAAGAVCHGVRSSGGCVPQQRRLWAQQQQQPGQQLFCLVDHHALVLLCHPWVTGSTQCLAHSGGTAAVLVLAGCGHKAAA